MPDKDMFQRTFAPGWRKAYRLAKDGAGDDSEIGAACIKALARSLRETKGCPGFNEIARIVTDVNQDKRLQPLFAAGGVINLIDPLVSLRQIEEKFQQNRITNIAARSARALFTEVPAKSNAEAKRNLAEKLCLDLIDHHFFGRGRNYFTDCRFGNFAEERKWETSVKEKLRESLSKLAANLIKNPNSRGIRAPSQKGIRKTTKELLDQPL